jgi:putative serine protease PepD
MADESSSGSLFDRPRPEADVNGRPSVLPPPPPPPHPGPAPSPFLTLPPQPGGAGQSASGFPISSYPSAPQYPSAPPAYGEAPRGIAVASPPVGHSPYNPTPPGPPPAFGGGSPGGSPSTPPRPGRKLLAGAAALAAVGLLAGGIGIGTRIDDNSNKAGTPIGSAPTGTTQSGAGGSVNTSAGPTTDEPVADAAKVVQPSVVLIVTDEGLGSGIVFDATGNIVTNAHVVGTATTVSVQFNTGAKLEGKVVNVDSRRDIAVIKVTPKDAITPATFAESNDIRVGQMAIAVGSPFGLDQTVTAGIVSAVDRIVASGRTTDSTQLPMIQTDAPINPGNSGGALADREGRVIGMNTSIRTDGTTNGNVGVGFAVPSDTIVSVANRILKGETLASAYLGVSTKDGDNVAGAVVTDISAGSPADKAGMKVGDRITGLDAQAIKTKDDLRARVQLHKPGDVSQLSIVRSDGSTVKLSVTFGQA